MSAYDYDDLDSVEEQKPPTLIISEQMLEGLMASQTLEHYMMKLDPEYRTGAVQAARDLQAVFQTTLNAVEAMQYESRD